MTSTLYDTNYMTREEARDLIRSEAGRLASLLKSEGFKISRLEHSGSAAGLSSYIDVFCPVTGIYIHDIRISDHSKGQRMGLFVTNVAGDDDFNDLINHLKARREKVMSRPNFKPKNL